LYNTGNRSNFADSLLQWYNQNKRSLPWRRTNEPYLVWISEIMLQQTQVDTVIPYFTKWIEAFPSVEIVAKTPFDDVVKYWEGLGILHTLQKYS